MASKSYDPDWQMKAIHEQFDVFNSLKAPVLMTVPAQGNKMTKTIKDVLKKHWRFNEGSAAYSSSVAECLIQMFNSFVRNLNSVKFSFVVIVTNQRWLGGGLCKLPVFILTSDEFSVFITLQMNVFETWTAFMQKNSLPECKFCFPVDGHYNVGGRLKINFGSCAGTTHSLVKVSLFYNFVGKTVDACKAAASCLIKVAPVCLKVVSDLMPVAKRFVVQMFTKKAQILTLASISCRFRNGDIRIDDIFSAFKILVPLCEFIAKEITVAWKDVKKCLSEAYDELKKIFPEYFESASESSQHEFLAFVQSVDSKLVAVKQEAARKISEAYGYNSGSAVIQQEESYTNRQQISSNSLAVRRSSPRISTLEEETLDMLNIAKTFINYKESQETFDLKVAFESLSFTVFDEYKKEVDKYIQIIKAAKTACKGEFDVEAFNSYLGIKGHPSKYYLKEVLNNIKTSPLLSYKTSMKQEEFKSTTEIVLLPLWKKEDNGHDGLYKCIGVRGAGEFSSQDLLKTMEDNFWIQSKSAQTRSLRGGHSLITSEEFSILVVQEVNQEKTSEGVVFFQRC